VSSDSSDRLAGLYRETIRQHAAEPVGYRKSIAATHHHECYNALCGDRVEIRLRVFEERIEDAAFDGEACAICMASASILCDLAPGRELTEFLRLHDDLHRALENPHKPSPTVARVMEGPDVPKPPLQEELHPLLGVRPYPSRIQCATLPWKAARRALEAKG